MSLLNLCCKGTNEAWTQVVLLDSQVQKSEACFKVKSYTQEKKIENPWGKKSRTLEVLSVAIWGVVSRENDPLQRFISLFLEPMNYLKRQKI